MVGQSFGAPSVERQIETDVSSSFDSTETQPIDANQPLVSDPVLYLNETEGEWGEGDRGGDAHRDGLHPLQPEGLPH